MNTTKPLTFAAMLVRAQRRFNAMGKSFPNTMQPTAAQPWPGHATGAAARSAIHGLAQLMTHPHQDTVAG